MIEKRAEKLIENELALEEKFEGEEAEEAVDAIKNADVTEITGAELIEAPKFAKIDPLKKLKATEVEIDEVSDDVIADEENSFDRALDEANEITADAF